MQGSGVLRIGPRTFVGGGTVIGCNDEVAIGADVMIAQNVSIRDTDHAFGRVDIPMNQQGIETAAVTIADDVWIGHGAVILKGTEISRGAIIAAGAVVRGKVPAFAIYGGVPARQISSRLKS